MLFVGFVGDWVTDGYEYSYPGAGRVMRTPAHSVHSWTALAVRRPGQVM